MTIEPLLKINSEADNPLAHRAQLVCDALTILQSYQAAGRPPQNVPPFNRFEQWDREIRQALIWAGAPDPCATREMIIAGNPERTDHLTVLTNWYRAFGARAVTIAEVIKATDPASPSPDSDLFYALLLVAEDRDAPGKISSRRLGTWCGYHKSRIVGELRLDRSDDAANGFARFCVLNIKVTESQAEPIVEREV